MTKIEQSDANLTKHLKRKGNKNTKELNTKNELHEIGKGPAAEVDQDSLKVTSKKN